MTEFRLWKLLDDSERMEFVGYTSTEGLDYLTRDVVYYERKRESAKSWGKSAGEAFLLRWRSSH